MIPLVEDDAGAISCEVLLVIEGEIATTQLIEQMLSACAGHGLRYRKKLLAALDVDDFPPGTVPLFCRCGDPMLEYWVALLSGAGRPYLYYLDDNFWRIEGDSALAQYYRHPAIRRSVKLAVANAHRVLTSSTELAAFVARFNKRTLVLPPFFDFSLLDDAAPSAGNEIRIGFAGSASRASDLDLIRPIVAPLLSAHASVVFEFAGVLPPGVEPGDRVRFFPHVPDYASFIRFLAGRAWSIGLAPLHDTEANRCKTNNKYREYGACAIAAIYSDLPPYRGSVMPDVTGLLVPNDPRAWQSAIERLVADASLRERIGVQARADVREKHAVDRVAGEWAAPMKEVRRYMVGRTTRPLPVVAQRMGNNRLRARLARMRMRFAVAYAEGGFALVLKRSMGRLTRGFRPGSPRGIRRNGA